MLGVGKLLPYIRYIVCCYVYTIRMCNVPDITYEYASYLSVDVT